MKDHELRELINSLTAVAVKYHDTQQLREQIAHLVVPAFSADKAIVTAWEQFVSLQTGDVKALCNVGVENERLKLELSKFQESEFHPDWSLLKATQESLREYMVMAQTLKREKASLCEAFRVNMILAHPNKSHAEIDEELSRIFSA